MEDKRFLFHRVDKDKNTDVWEEVEPELWQWEAVYNDGTVLKQYDTDYPLPELGANAYLFHQSVDIDQSKLQLLRVVSPRLNQFHILIWNPERWKLVMKYIRANLVMKVWRSKKTKEVTQTERRVFTAFVYGYENKVGGIVIKNFNIIMPNNEVITTDNLDNIRLDAKPIEEWID